MDPRNDLVSLFVLLIALADQRADCLSTEKCSHDQLISAFHGFEICMGMGHIPFKLMNNHGLFLMNINFLGQRHSVDKAL